ncbi:MAG: hypothetical protein A3D44_04365 [Candidatus Staskawiczbacteria bacterium RIFCSPHIGHO2_02_FULL_42_22]|uniref:HicB-like antitoxin of toxin-antitoxin system domain-containing protein n=1 Tax=Candidatus Staskawiczbacteria bacterium RIFCSPHIGHO2_02_FULL_42_22 TaxID=1802207 RepID=A0A1G2I6S2_9BACT|nr:MAG: hypothetical protein A3D44_04365 [Candidatus Staskawiczbacteria bacterium RIFCSPHIGHO2_02_FULL_42_22]
MKKVVLQFNIPVSILREGKKYVAYTPALDLSTSGDTFDQVKHRFEEIVDIFFEEILKKGTIEEVLTELGWQKNHATWVPPVVVSQEFQTIQVSY